MTIYRLLKETAFDPEAVKRMASAFEETCRSLGVATNDEPRRERIARTVIDIAQAGERDPVRLCERTLDALKERPRPA